MRHMIFDPSDRYPVALLIKNGGFNKPELISNYLAPMEHKQIPNNKVIAFTLEYNSSNKAPVAFIKQYLDQLLPVLDTQGVQYLFVTDSAYFKVLTKTSKAEPYYGYIMDCKYPGYEHFKVVLSVNYQMLVYNPAIQDKLNLSIHALATHIQGTYQSPGQSIIHTAHYPSELNQIRNWLKELHKYDTLTCDIETFSLRFPDAGIATIAFAWDQHNGIAFPCDISEYLSTISERISYFAVNSAVRGLLREFFEQYKGTLIWHNASFDVKIIVYTLFMDDYQDYPGLLRGLEVMSRHVHDTKIITYLATNSTADVHLSLKSQAQEFAGNWAVEEIKDIQKVPLKELLQYNLVDALSTWYVFNKHYPTMVADNQEPIYKDLMLPSFKLLVQMELVGMPMDPQAIKDTEYKLEELQQEYLQIIRNNPLIKTLDLLVQTKVMNAANAKLKTKQHPIEKFSAVTFNPNSNEQLRQLLYELMGLPVVDLTETKQAATGKATIKKLMDHPNAAPYTDVLRALIDYGEVTKILNTFMPAFKAGLRKKDGMLWLHGSFNIGGTVSGRLSSSGPNMQNLPAGKTYGKIIKAMFMAAKGWLFCGADFSSLEDRINALLTKDPNKLKVYTDGFDGHCLRAYAYFGNQMSDIINTVASINSIETKYPLLRQKSKTPTFALTYQGTHFTLMKNLGMSETEAKEIEDSYHNLYKVSDQWTQDKISQAARDGYAEVAFGLRIRTPLLSQVMWGSNFIPYAAQQEARTLGNAISGQSYGLLNNRAAVAFFEKVWASKYRYDILPVSLIHDAIYILVREDVEVLEWANRELTKEMSWQDLPEIYHPDVKLGAELDVFYPNWSTPLTLPNDATAEDIMKLCKAHAEKLNKPETK